MTPFGEKIRQLRKQKRIQLKQMAADLNVSSAYLSALEHGHRGRPSAGFVLQVCGYLGVIWDEAEELKRLAELSHPRVTIDTSGLPAKATLAANLLSRKVGELEEDDLEKIINIIR